MVKPAYEFFDYREEDLSCKLLFLVGPCRSGKSSVGRLLGSLPHFFHVEENWSLLMLPILCEKGLLDREVFINTYRALLSELVYDAILMRSASFRPSDHSFIRRMKSDREVEFSLTALKSRRDVDDYLRSHPVTLVFNLAEVNPFLHLLEDVYPSAAFVHLLRHPARIASEILEKKWFSDESLKNPTNRQVFLKRVREGRSFYIPFWVKQEEAHIFLDMTEEERARKYPFELYRLTAESLGRVKKLTPQFLYYEDFLKDPSTFLKSLGVKPVGYGEKTKNLIEEIRSRQERGLAASLDLDAPPREALNLIDCAIGGFIRHYASARDPVKGAAR